MLCDIELVSQEDLTDGWKMWTNMPEPEPQYYKILKPLSLVDGLFSTSI